MGGIGADGLVPFGGLIPPGFHAEEDRLATDADQRETTGAEGEHVVGVEPVGPTVSPDRQVDPDIGPVPGSPNRDDPDTPDPIPEPRKDEPEPATDLRQSRLDDEQPVDVDAAVDEAAAQASDRS